MAYFGVGLQDVNFPLMTLVDYRGFRLAAISILPVTKGLFENFFLSFYLGVTLLDSLF